MPYFILGGDDPPTDDELLELKQRLIDAGIEVSVSGCGCCGSPHVLWRNDDGTIVHVECADLDTFAEVTGYEKMGMGT
jgi:hypothetical protein